jgi:hypothetical protein
LQPGVLHRIRENSVYPRKEQENIVTGREMWLFAHLAQARLSH